MYLCFSCSSVFMPSIFLSYSTRRKWIISWESRLNLCKNFKIEICKSLLCQTVCFQKYWNRFEKLIYFFQFYFNFFLNCKLLYAGQFIKVSPCITRNFCFITELWEKHFNWTLKEGWCKYWLSQFQGQSKA